ncbi:MAG: hypothetical protein R2753_11685 [Chitinophagales bacterium]
MDQELKLILRDGIGIYNGTGTSVTVTGLTGLTDYQVMVVEQLCPGSEQYLSSTATGNPDFFTTLAPTVPTIFVSTKFNSF